MRTVRGGREISDNLKISCVKEIRRLADLARQVQAGLGPAQRLQGPALDSVAELIAGLDQADQRFMSLSVINQGLGHDRRCWEPGPEQRKLLAQVGTIGSGSIPSKEELLAELILAGAEDLVKSSAKAKQLGEVMPELDRLREEVQRIPSLQRSAEEAKLQLEATQARLAELEPELARVTEERDFLRDGQVPKQTKPRPKAAAAA